MADNTITFSSFGSASPGERSGFNGPGYFRLAFCVDEKVIALADKDGLRKALR